jgi:hypothetical protein
VNKLRAGYFNTSLNAPSSPVILNAPILLDSMDSITGWSAPGNGAIFNDTTYKVQGTAAQRLQGNGVAAVTPITTKTLGTPITDITTLGVIARYINNRIPGVTVSDAIQFGNAGSTFSSITNNVTNVSIGSQSELGGAWYSHHYTEDATLASLGTLTQLRRRAGSTLNAPYYNNATMDAVCINAAGRPTIVIGFDDGENTTPIFAQPYMTSKSMVGTVYLPTSNIGTSSRMTWIQARALRDAGWAICLDGTPDDTDMTLQASVAAAVSFYKTGQAALVANGIDDDGKNHFCYPFGTSQVSPNPVQVAAVTSNGTTTVTFGSAANVTNGMSYYGYNVPDGTTVVSGGGTSVTSVVVSNTIPTQTKAAMFLDETGEFYRGKLPAALAEVGVKSGRTTSGVAYYSRFGFGDKALVLPGVGLTAATWDATKLKIDNAILRGETIEFYIHRIVPDSGTWLTSTPNPSINVYESFFTTMIDYLATKRDAGILDVLTKPQLYNRDFYAKSPY